MKTLFHADHEPTPNRHSASLRTTAEMSPEYRKAYLAGWNSYLRSSDPYRAIERADNKNTPQAWYNGFFDAEAGREKFHTVTSSRRTAAVWQPFAQVTNQQAQKLVDAARKIGYALSVDEAYDTLLLNGGFDSAMAKASVLEDAYGDVNAAGGVDVDAGFGVSALVESTDYAVWVFNGKDFKPTEADCEKMAGLLRTDEQRKALQRYMTREFGTTASRRTAASVNLSWPLIRDSWKDIIRDCYAFQPSANSNSLDSASVARTWGDSLLSLVRAFEAAWNNGPSLEVTKKANQMNDSLARVQGDADMPYSVAAARHLVGAMLINRPDWYKTSSRHTAAATTTTIIPAGFTKGNGKKFVEAAETYGWEYSPVDNPYAEQMRFMFIDRFQITADREVNSTVTTMYVAVSHNGAYQYVSDTLNNLGKLVYRVDDNTVSDVLALFGRPAHILAAATVKNALSNKATTYRR